MRHNDIADVLAKPIAQDLLHTTPLMRMACTGTGGGPRVIPVGFLFDGATIIVCTTPRAAKVPALAARPGVALTIDTDTQAPRALLLRGTATMETVDGVPPEYLAMNRKVGEPEQWRAFEHQVRARYEQMVRITITPHWAELLDFETTLPTAVEELVRRKQPHLLPGT